MRRSKNPWRLPTSIENLEANTLWDGLFHLFTLLCVGASNEQVPVSQWVFRDWGFILLGTAFFILGYVLNAGERQGLAPGAP